MKNNPPIPADIYEHVKYSDEEIKTFKKESETKAERQFRVKGGLRAKQSRDK